MMPNMVILAAGKGTRMKSKMIKVAHQLGGRPMVSHVVRLAHAIGVERPIVVVGYDRERVQELLGEGIDYVYQAEQLGTGHAVMQAVPLLAGRTGPTIVISGDTPLLRAETMQRLIQMHTTSNAAATLLTVMTDDPTGYGRIIRRADGLVDRIVEHKDASAEERLVREINLSTYCFDTPLLIEILGQIDNDNAQGEYYLTDCIEILSQRGHPVVTHVVEDPTETVMPNDRVQMAEAERIIRQRIRDRHMRCGVTMIDPDTTFIDDEVVIGTDTIIHPFTIIRGRSVIGSDCEIGPFVELTDGHVADGERVTSPQHQASGISRQKADA